jgi:hypothetical protein
MAFQIHRLAEKTIFVHEIADDAEDLEAALEFLKDATPVGHAAWLCTDAEGCEGFLVWRTEENLMYDAGCMWRNSGCRSLPSLA